MTAPDECLGHVHGRSRTERHADSGWMASRRVDGGRHMMVQHLALCVGKLAAKPALSTKPFT